MKDKIKTLIVVGNTASIFRVLEYLRIPEYATKPLNDITPIEQPNNTDNNEDKQNTQTH